MEHNNDNDELTNNNDLDTGSVMAPIYSDEVLYQRKDKSLCRPLKLANNGLFTRTSIVGRGITSALSINSKVFSLSYRRIEQEKIDLKLFEKYLPNCTGKHRRLAFKVLQCVCSHPYSNRSYMVNLTGVCLLAINYSIDKLKDLGFIIEKGKYRKMMMLNSYTRDKVYVITAKGKLCLRNIYEESGLLN